jgi:hypothetical protein
VKNLNIMNIMSTNPTCVRSIIDISDLVRKLMVFSNQCVTAVLGVLKKES